MNWLDWLIIAVIVLSALSGLRRGLILSLTKTIGLLAGLLVAFNYHRQVADYLALYVPVEKLIAPLTLPMLRQPTAEMMSFLPINQLLEQVNKIIAYGILSSVSFLLLLIITASIIGAFGRLLNMLLNISLLKPMNKLGGLLFGVLVGVLYVTALLYIMSPFQQLNLSLAASGNPLWNVFPPGEAFQGSVLLKHFQPLLDLTKTNLPVNLPPLDTMPPIDNVPPIELFPDSSRDISI